jgi:hypothetical protein
MFNGQSFNVTTEKIMKDIIQRFYFLAVILAGMVSVPMRAQNIYDNFNGTTVNTNFRTIILPFAQSQITESGGYLTTTGRGTLATASGFSFPYTVSGAVTLNTGFEHFGTTLRSDLTTSTASGLLPYYVLTGICVGFSADGNQVSIQQIDATNPNPPILSETNFNFIVGQSYNFVITDTGSNVSLAINGTNLISANTTFGTGNKVGLQSREFSYTSSSIDFLQIIQLPIIGLIKSVKPSFSNLALGTNYQLQVSGDLSTWTNSGVIFTATNSSMVSTQYFDVNNWNHYFSGCR